MTSENHEAMTQHDLMTQAVLHGDAAGFAVAYKESRLGFIVDTEAILVQYLPWINEGVDFIYDLSCEVVKRHKSFKVRDEIWLDESGDDAEGLFASQVELGADAEGGAEDRVERTMQRFTVEAAFRVGALVAAEGDKE